MFGIGFSELIVIVIAAIIFIGPERLPKLGQKLGELLRSYRNLKTDFHNKVYEAESSSSTTEKESS